MCDGDDISDEKKKKMFISGFLSSSCGKILHVNEENIYIFIMVSLRKMNEN